METKYSKDISCLKPFVEAARGYVPTNRLLRVSGFKVPIGKREWTQGQHFVLHGWRRITIRTHTQHGRKYRPRTIEDVVLVLAHELTHTVHWDHDMEFTALYIDLMVVFSEVLAELGVEDIQAPFTDLQGYYEKSI